MRYGISETKVAWRSVDGEAVLLHTDTSAYFGLNGIGTVLWQVLAEHPMSTEELVAWARRHWAAAPAEADSDIAGFIAQLEALDLLEPAADGQVAAAGSGPGAVPGPTPYERPVVQQFGELEKLILSGE